MTTMQGYRAELAKRVLRRRCGHPGTGEPVVGGLVYGETNLWKGMRVVRDAGEMVTVQNPGEAPHMLWTLASKEWAAQNPDVLCTWSFPTLKQIQSHESEHSSFVLFRNLQQATGHLGNGRPAIGGTIHVTIPDYTGMARVDSVDVHRNWEGGDKLAMVQVTLNSKEYLLSSRLTSNARWRFLSSIEVTEDERFRMERIEIRKRYADRYIGKATSYGGGSPVASEIAADRRIAQENAMKALDPIVADESVEDRLRARALARWNRTPIEKGPPTPTTLVKNASDMSEVLNVKITEVPPDDATHQPRTTLPADSYKFTHRDIEDALIPSAWRFPLTIHYPKAAMLASMLDDSPATYPKPPPPPPMNQGDKITISMGGRYNIPGVYSQYLKDEKAHEVWVEDVGHFFLRRDLFRAVIEGDEKTYMPEAMTCITCKANPVTSPTHAECSPCQDGREVVAQHQEDNNKIHASDIEENKRAWSRRLIEEQGDMRRMSSINRIGNARWDGRVRQ